MELQKTQCCKIYDEIKLAIREELIKRKITFKGSETSLWRMQNPEKNDITYFQQLLEEKTKTTFSSTFNNMYLWRKKNEANVKEFINFQDEYLCLFVKYLGYKNPYEYFNESVENFFYNFENKNLLVIQPIFDIKKITPKFENDKIPTGNGQPLDAYDTECVYELMNLLYRNKISLPTQKYDQNFVTIIDNKFVYNDTLRANLNSNFIFSIGLFSNYFTRWVLDTYATEYLEYIYSSLSFRVKYFNQNSKTTCWSDYYKSTDVFDVSFFMKIPIKINEGEKVCCYLMCGIENYGTRAVATYLVNNWQTICEKQDYETNERVKDSPFIIVLKVNKKNLQEISTERIIKLDWQGITNG